VKKKKYKGTHFGVLKMGSESLLVFCALLTTTLYFALSVSLLAVTDFGEQKRSKDIAIALSVLTGIPIGIGVLAVTVTFVGMITGKLVWWA